MINYFSKVSKISTFKAATVNQFGNSETAKILVVDDHPFSRMTAVDLLKLDGYEVLEADGSSDIVEEVLQNNPDLILLDVLMPQQDGFAVCQRLKEDKRTALIPVILMTVADDPQSHLKSREVGADGLLIKPLERVQLLAKAELLIHKKRLHEWLEQIEQVLFLIAQAIEDRYSDGGGSSARMDQLAQSFGEYLHLSPADINDLIFAARLHDIGTLAIPDAVLLKKGDLTEQERELLKQHVLIGEKICTPIRNYSGVPRIIRHHHERWNGSGYPDGLVGEQIPKLAQVFQMLDIYDALTSKRPHKQPLRPQQALDILAEEAAKGWRNPDLAEKFIDFIHTTLEPEKYE
jgi:putative two-component system response regulator